MNADGNMPYDICEDEAALDLIESEMARRGVTQQLIDNTRSTTEHRMLQELQQAIDNNQSYLLESYDHQGATPVINININMFFNMFLAYKCYILVTYCCCQWLFKSS